MRKSAVAVMAGLMLVAGQAAAAASNTAAVRVGDRVGAKAGAATNEFLGVSTPVLLLGAAVVATGVAVAAQNGDDSPTSP
jgi:hypothetical protein